MSTIIIQKETLKIYQLCRMLPILVLVINEVLKIKFVDNYAEGF